MGFNANLSSLETSHFSAAYSKKGISWTEIPLRGKSSKFREDQKSYERFTGSNNLSNT